MVETYDSAAEPSRPTASNQWPQEALFRRGRWWWLASAIAIGVLLGLGSLQIISLVARALAVVFLGATLAAALSPIVAWLDRYLPRILAVLAVYLAIASVFALLGWLVIPRVWTEAQLVADMLPGWIEQSRGWIQNTLGQQPDAWINALAGLADSLGAGLATVPGSVISLGAALIVALFISVYWLILENSIKQSFLSLFPEPRDKDMHTVLSGAARSMGGYLRGVMIDSVAVAVLTYVGLLIIGVDYALVLAVIMGLFEIIPVIGAALGFVVVTAIALLQGPTTGLITGAFMIALQQIENHVLTPNVMSSQTDASPLLVLIAVFAGGAVGGFLGALVAIPLAAFLQVIFVQAVAPAFRRGSGAPPVDTEEADDTEREE